MRVLSLFSGAGLGDYGWELAGHEIVGQVEIDEYCQQILNLRWPDVPKWRDITKVEPKQLPKYDVLTGGFPCQPFSVAGRKKGADDTRNMWPQMRRIIEEVRPTWVVGENVPGLVSIYLDTVLDDLEALGYASTTLSFPASALGANHKRERIWIVAHAQSHDAQREPRAVFQEERRSTDGQCGEPSCTGSEASHLAHAIGGCKMSPLGPRTQWTSDKKQNDRNQLRHDIGNGGQNIPDPNGSGFIKQRRTQPDESKYQATQCGDWWSVEPRVGRVAHGVPSRVDRLKALGNGQVVQVTQWLGSLFKELEEPMIPLSEEA